MKAHDILNSLQSCLNHFTYCDERMPDFDGEYLCIVFNKKRHCDVIEASQVIILNIKNHWIYDWGDNEHTSIIAWKPLDPYPKDLHIYSPTTGDLIIPEPPKDLSSPNKKIPYRVYEEFESFAQASITAKQKEWEEEKAELVNSLDWLYRNTTLLASSIKVKDLDESLIHAGKLIKKHTNE